MIKGERVNMDMAKDMGVISQRREKIRRKTFEEQHKA
jgi:hypothetical protein